MVITNLQNNQKLNHLLKILIYLNTAAPDNLLERMPSLLLVAGVIVVAITVTTTLITGVGVLGVVMAIFVIAAMITTLSVYITGVIILGGARP